MSTNILTVQEELERNKSLSTVDLSKSILDGAFNDAVSHILFFAKPESWKSDTETLIEELAKSFPSAGNASKAAVLNFLLRLAIDLKSNLTGWYLADKLSPGEADSVSAAALSALKSLEGDSAAEPVMAYLLEDDTLRLKAEGLDEAAASKEASELCSSTLSSYAEKMISLVNSGNMEKIALAAQKKDSMTVLGNDYGDFLLYAMRLGFSFQTTNPPLVKMAWDGKPAVWKNRFAMSKKSYNLKTSSSEEQVMHMTMEVVGYSAALIRPVFLTTGGKLGYVCYQVSPMNHNNAAAMIAELEAVYTGFQERFGGEPNISFKIPGTAAGLEAAKVLSPKGYSFTVTLSFAAFQTLEFGKVLNAGSALFNAVVVMNGRLAFPVRDELLAADVPGAEKAAEYAGVEVCRKIYRKMYSPSSEGGLGIAKSKVKIMNASLRIYGQEIPDIAEIWGSPSITVFPNVRRAYDAISRDFNDMTVEKSTPADAMKVLQKSEIFRQAWWVEGDDADLKPAKQLTLDAANTDAVVAWQPIAETLKAFIQTYQDTAELGKTLA